MKIKKVINNPDKIGPVTLTMTCSKRIHLFKRVIKSFYDHCLDKELISKILIYDDSSSPEDRGEMETILNQLFPDNNIIYTYFNEMPTKYRHAYIMQHWYDDIDTDFVFHLEDDRIMNEDFSLGELADLLRNDEQVGIVFLAQTRRKFPNEFLEEYNLSVDYPKNENYWIWPYVKTKECGESLFYDEVRSEEGSKELGFGYYEYFINYAGFGLQPCLMDVNKIHTIEKFELTDMLEGSFGKKYSDKYISICYNKSKSTHIGSDFFNEKSAYTLNESLR